MSLTQGGCHLAQAREAPVEPEGGTAEVRKFFAEQDAAVFEDAFSAQVAPAMAWVGVEAGLAAVGEGAGVGVVAVDAVGALPMGRTLRVVGGSVQNDADRGGVDDAQGRVAIALFQDAAGKAEDAVSRLGGAPNGRLADGQRQKGSKPRTGRRRTGRATTVRGELVEVGPQPAQFTCRCRCWECWGGLRTGRNGWRPGRAASSLGTRVGAC